MTHALMTDEEDGDNQEPQLSKNLKSCCGWFPLHTHLLSVQCQQSYNSCSGVWNTQSFCSHQRKYTLVRKLTCPFLHSFCDLITNVWATKCNDVTSHSIFSFLFTGHQRKISLTKQADDWRMCYRKVCDPMTCCVDLHQRPDIKLHIWP